MNILALHLTLKNVSQQQFEPSQLAALYQWKEHFFQKTLTSGAVYRQGKSSTPAVFHWYGNQMCSGASPIPCPTFHLVTAISVQIILNPLYIQKTCQFNFFDAFDYLRAETNQNALPDSKHAVVIRGVHIFTFVAGSQRVKSFQESRTDHGNTLEHNIPQLLPRTKSERFKNSGGGRKVIKWKDL